MASTFPGVIAFAFMVCMLLLGTVLRAKVAFLRNALVPACLIGGLLGFGLVASGLAGYESSDFTAFTFHFFTLSFMSLCLTGSGKPRGEKSSIVPGGSWMSVVWVMSLVMQGVVGLVAILGYNAVSGNDLSHFLGMIATHGFTQGPGQAVAMGSLWENELGITHAVNFGVIYASVGFVVAFVVGVPIARRAIKAGVNFNRAARIDDEFLKGILDRESNVSAGRQVTHSANVDTLAFHVSILGVAYVLTDQYLLFMRPIADAWVVGDVNFGVIFSHNLFFFHGLMFCVIMRALMDRFGLGHYIDDETQRRITGTSVDFMVVATIMSIQAALLAEFIVPIALVCVLVAVSTAALCFGFGRKLSSLSIERAVTSFGCCCGSTGSGLLLLRILDPDLSTPIAKELAFFNIAILILSFHVLGLMAPILPSYDLLTICAVYVGTFVIGAVVLSVLTRRVVANPVTAAS
ncbi:MAG: sodium:glutamate symporter [Gammaproteobacteria bacterium]|nr:sodium:glutamate symporter [Gammaproteobacteria bacterium]